MRALLSLEVVTALAVVSMLGISIFSYEGQDIISNAYAQSTATIWTDKLDYAPGETVTIYGSGFNVNSTVWLVIYNPLDETVSWDTTSDSSGNFVTQFTLGGYQPYYRVIATDGQNQAETTFTDSINIKLESVSSSNSGGTSKTSFITSENVYAAVLTSASGSNEVIPLTVDIYTVSGACPTNNQNIGSDVSGGVESETYSTAGTHVENVWSAPTAAGSYCIVVDSHSSGTLGKFDNGKDAVAAFSIASPPKGNLTVIKRIINDNGGDAIVTDFTLKINATNVINGTETELSPGFYNVTEESSKQGYTSSFSGDCDSFGGITIASGDDKTCTITNNDIPPALFFVKYVINDNGGTETNFTPFVANASQPNETILANNTSNALPYAGIYNITENVDLTKYTVTFGDDCAPDGQITIGINETLTCSITNDDIAAPQLTIIKNIINDNGGAATLEGFSFFVNGTEVYNNTAVEFAAGFYNVSETGAAGYNTTFSGDCDEFGGITLSIGDDKTCTITNDDIPPKLLFIKYVINDNGGTETDFTPFKANETLLTNNTETELPLAGTYNVTENNVFGYNATFGDDCAPDGQITIGINETLTCSITNDDIPPKLLFIKYIVNDNGGTETDFGPFMANETLLTNNTTTDLPKAGKYNITENQIFGYNATYGADCAPDGFIKIAINQTMTCTITNDDIAPKLTILKTIINDDGGVAELEDFEFFVNETSVTNGTATDFDAGFYTVTETGPIIYIRTFEGDCDESGGITMSIGEEYTCMITNDDISPFKVTSSSLCEIPNNQFRDIFTVDPSNISYFKDTATNPGQFYVNILVTGDEGDSVDIPVTLPYPFVTQGANPIQVHDGVSLDSNECYIPSGSVEFEVDGLSATSPSGNYIVVLDDYGSPAQVGTTQTTFNIIGEIPESGLFYITIHIDFGLKGSGPWAKGANDDATPVTGNPYTTTIPNGVELTFEADGFDDQELTKANVFKKTPGFYGILTGKNDEQPLNNVQVTFFDSKGKKIGTATTDENGYYNYAYKYTGKPTTVTIKVANYGIQVSATMKANGYVSTNFEV